MRICLFLSLLALPLFLSPEIASAAPKRYFWGQLSGSDGVSFHRQGSNISEFHATIPMRCEFTDGTTDDVNALVSGPEVPNMYVSRSRFSAEFSAYVEGLLVEGDIEITGRFHGNRATVTMVVNSTFSDGTCYGGIVYSNVRRGARIRR